MLRRSEFAFVFFSVAGAELRPGRFSKGSDMKIRFLKDYKGRVKGDECEVADARADSLIDRGIAERANAPKSRKTRRKGAHGEGG